MVLTDVQAQAPSSQPIAPAQSSGQALVAQKPSELSWGQKLLGLGAIVTAGAGAGVLTKVCTPCFIVSNPMGEKKKCGKFFYSMKLRRVQKQ